MIARRVGRALCALLIAAGILFGPFLVVPALMGWERYVIVSGSMTGTYDRGLARLRRGRPHQVAEGRRRDHLHAAAGGRPQGPRDPPDRARSVTTRRPATASTAPRATPTPSPIRGPSRSPDKKQARVVTGVPKVGFVLAALAERNVRMLIVGLPALLIAFFALVGLWRDAGAEAEAQAAAAGATAA